MGEIGFYSPMCLPLIMNFQQILGGNEQAAYWFNMLTDVEKRALPSVFDTVFATTDYYNRLFPGFTVWLTGSSLNLAERYYNDIDLMVVIPAEDIRKAKSEMLGRFWGLYKEQNITALMELAKDPRTRVLGLSELLATVTDSLRYSLEIRNQNRPALEKRANSPNEVNRVLMDAAQELEATKVKVDGQINMEKNVAPADADGTQGYQFGPLVVSFLSNVDAASKKLVHDGNSIFTVDWRKSFSEGYEAGAGDNNCYIYNPNADAAPVHLFLTTKVDPQKAMEKKESFMLEYLTPQERMQPIRLI